MKSYAFLFWGYLVVWAGLMAYFVALSRRISSVARRLDTLESKTFRKDEPRST